MEFLDEDARPRFVLKSKPSDQSSSSASESFSKPILIVTLTLSSSLIVFSLFFLNSEPWKSLLLWISLSLLLGPLAPPSLTAGDVRVGRGPVLELSDSAEEEQEKRPRAPRIHRRPEEPAPAMAVELSRSGPTTEMKKNDKKDEVWEEKEWTEEDIEVLKKQLIKNPAGKPGRWDSIAESFYHRHGIESVIAKAKELGEKKNKNDDDAYSEFLRRRKPSDKKVSFADQATVPEEPVFRESPWSSGEDIALLNALKAFPKEAALRWEKVAAAVPGRSKAACVKRVAELKKGFRDMKKTSDEAQD